MLQKLSGIEYIGTAIERVIESKKYVWIVCSDEEEQEQAYLTAIQKLETGPSYYRGSVNIEKGETTSIVGNRYKDFPALLFTYNWRRSL